MIFIQKALGFVSDRFNYSLVSSQGPGYHAHKCFNSTQQDFTIKVINGSGKKSLN